MKRTFELVIKITTTTETRNDHEEGEDIFSHLVDKCESESFEFHHDYLIKKVAHVD